MLSMSDSASARMGLSKVQVRAARLDEAGGGGKGVARKADGEGGPRKKGGRSFERPESREETPKEGICDGNHRTTPR